ncbi:hypothetical protein [Streptacidiphilus sp. PAMC 29251]
MGNPPRPPRRPPDLDPPTRRPPHRDPLDPPRPRPPPFNDHTWHHIKNTLTHHNPDRHQHEADLADALDQLQRRTRNGTATPTEHTLDNHTASTRTPPDTDHDRPAHGDEREQQHEQAQSEPHQREERPQAVEQGHGEPEQHGCKDTPRHGDSTGRAGAGTAKGPGADTGQHLQPAAHQGLAARKDDGRSADPAVFEDEGQPVRDPDQDDHQDREDLDDGNGAQVPYTGLGLYDAEKEAELW